MTAYARATMDPNQGEPAAPGAAAYPVPGVTPLVSAAFVAGDAVHENEAERAVAARREAAELLGGSVHRGLMWWLAITLAGTTVALYARRSDAAFFLALAALFALAQAWDVRDRALAGELAREPALEPGLMGRLLRILVPPVVPVGAVACFVLLGAFARGLPASPAHGAAVRWCWAAGAACLATAIPAVARLVARVVLPRSPDSFTARLTAPIALALLLLPVPARLLIGDLLSFATGTGRPLVDVGALVAQLAGEVLLACGAVGLWVARDAGAARERLGLGRIRARHALVAVAGLAAVLGINSGMEALEHARFPALWAADQGMGRLIAGDLSIAASIVLGVSAGVGEELLVRGALQPRAGLFWASVLFMAGHVQYTWFGMITIALLGMALGLVRDRANTTTAIVVHAIYDIIAALGAK